MSRATSRRLITLSENAQPTACSAAMPEFFSLAPRKLYDQCQDAINHIYHKT
jgi:hypothetical protein